MHKERGTSGGSKPVRIGDLCMGLISRLHQVLEWLCGLCRPTGKMDGQHGGRKGWTWLYRGREVGTMPSCTRAGLPMVAGRGSEVKKESRIRVTNPEDGAQSAHGCTEGVRKVCKGSAEVHGRGCKGSMEVHGRVCKGSVEGRGRVRRWGRSPGRVGGWCRCGGCRPRAEKGKNRKFSWEGVDGGGTRAGGVWGECQLSLEGSGSLGGGGNQNGCAHAHARKSKIRWSLNENFKRVASKIDDWRLTII